MIESKEYHKFGYYTGGPFNRPTRSKLEAIEWCRPHKSWPTWYFHDEEFSSRDWTVEPTESLEQLYQRRARELRAQYDYLVVQYSGGVDSHNVLMSFLSQNIIPDEVLFFYYSFCEEENCLGIEWKLQTHPKLQKLKQQYPDLNIRKLDLTPYAIDYIKSADDYDSFRMIGRYAVRINPTIRGRFTNIVPDYVRIKEQGKTIRMLSGTDKPRLRYHNKKFIFNFYDIVNDENIETAETSDSEWFFWHPDSVEILIKQAHVAKNYWAVHMTELHSMKCQYNQNLGWILDHLNETVNQLIYPWHNNDFYLPTTFTKSYTGLIGNRDIEFLTSNNDLAQKYINTGSAIIQSIDPMYFNQQNPSKGLVSSVSRDYFIT
jgi:hypothetical protein